jgi:pilus assembly protein CpaB
LEPGPETGLAIQVSPGKRPVTIPVTPERANANLIRPGDRVDIFAVIDSGKGLSQKREVTLLSQDVTVLATGVNVQNNLPRTIEKDPTGRNLIQTTLTGDTRYSNVTLEVKAEEAQDIIFLANTNASSIILVLRNPNDRKALPRMPASSADSIQSRTSGLSTGPTAISPLNSNGLPGR